MLRKLESLACLLAALLALSVEACLVHYIRRLPPANPPASRFASSSEWTSIMFPQCWLAGPLVTLFYYLMLALPADPEKVSRARRTFLRTWYWFLALASAQGPAPYPGCLTLVQR
jgi:hypothetical protein